MLKLAIVAVAVAIQHAAVAGEGGMSGTLYWRNGDGLTGTLLDASSSQVRWQADMFPEPFLLDVGKLDWLAVAGDRPFESAEGPFRFSVGTDDVLGGELVGVAGEFLAIRSRAHGSLSVKRAMVAGFQRVEAALNQPARMSELSTWTTLHRGRDVAEWKMTGEGGFATRVVGAELFRDLQLAETAEVDIVLRWERKPGFLVSFADPGATRLPNDVVKLETWEDDLVLQALGSSGDFKLLRNVSRGVESIRLRLVWNQRTAELTVLAADGRLLGTLKGTANSAAGHTALYIQNKSTALTVARVRVSSPTIISPDRPHEGKGGIWLESGEAIAGSVQGLDPATGTLRIELERGGMREIAMTDVARVDLNAGPAVAGPPPELQIGCRDGRQLSGVLRSFGTSELLLQTAYADAPIRVAADSIRRLRFLAADTSSAAGEPDVMHVGRVQLRGSLAPAGAETRSLGWKPVGAASASPLPRQTDVRICRAAATADASAAADGPGDRLFLRQGDVVPGRVLAVDEAGLLVDTAMAARTRIDRRHVKAVAFGASERLVRTDFTDPAWSVVTQAESVAERTPNEIVLHGPAWLARSDLLPADEISFEVCWNDAVGVSVAVSLHTRDSQPPGTGQASVVMYRTSDDRVIVQGMPGGRGHVGASAGMRIDNGRTQVRLLLGRQEIVVADGDTEIMRIPHGRADQAGRGFMLHVQRTAGGGVFASGSGQPAQLTISHFRARQSGEDLPSLEFDPQEKSRVLTVPRSRATDPPTEVLVARNGDLLRGHLVALDEHSVRFRSQLDELSFPRDRLAGIIWPEADTLLAEADTLLATPAEVEGVPVRVVFARDAVIRMTARSMTDRALLGHHAVLGSWEVPLPLIRELQAGPAATAGALTAFKDWVLRPAEEPSHASH